MVFANPIMTTHVHKTTNKPPMNSIDVGGYKNTNADNSKGGHYEPSVIIHRIPDHKNGHFLRPKKVALKYPSFKKDVDLDVHVKMFNSVVKANAKTFDEYIIIVLSYMLRDMALNW
jgi:hypothetical protein